MVKKTKTKSKSKSKNPKLAIFVPMDGGLAHYVCHLQEALKKYTDIHYITKKWNWLIAEAVTGPEDELIGKNIKNPVYLARPDDPASIFDILDYLKKKKIDIVNFQFNTTDMPYMHYFNVLFRKIKEMKIPIILTCHDVLQHTPASNMVPAINLAYEYADHFIVGNKPEYDKLRKNFKISKDRITIIEHGVYNKFDREKYTNESAKKKYKLQGKTVFLFFGFLRKYKGILTFVDSMKHVVKKHKNAGFHIAGSSWIEGKMHLQIEDEIKKHKLKGNVLYRDELIPLWEIEPTLKAADVIVLPYHNISQSGVLALSMYFKKPVIVSDIFYEAERINKKMGLVVKPKDVKGLANAMSYMIEHPDKMKEFGENGYNFIMTERRWDKIGEQMKGIFNKYLK